MAPKTPSSILTFVPAKDFERSTQFYKALGFQSNDDEDVRFISLGSFGFLLQDHYVEDWANNFMMAMHVEDAGEWYRHVKESGVIDAFPGTRVTEPKLEDWGMIVMHMVDPTGVLWHITQDP